MINFDWLPEKTRLLLEKLSRCSFVADFYLAGGTAAALFLNHRRSDDLDFFSEKEFNQALLVKKLKAIGKFEGLKNAENTIIGKLDDIKVSFFTLPYALLEPAEKQENLAVAQLVDLAAMKILAISDRGTKRDFVDLYWLCQNFKPLEELLTIFQKKFGEYDYNIYHIIKSLVYFEDADIDAMPQMRVDLKWQEVKKFFIGEKEKLGVEVSAF